MNKTWIVARREFVSRVSKKTFLLTTILLPLLICGFYAAMIYFSVKGNDNQGAARWDKKKYEAVKILQQQLDSARNAAKVTFQSTKGKKDHSGPSQAVGFITGILIYIVLFIYGTMVMRGVMEEKVNRIAEVIVSSVKPFQLMMGKIFGIGAVGLLQFIIWIILVSVIRLVVMPIFMPGADTSAIQGMPGAGAMTAAPPGGSAAFMSALSELNFPLLLGAFLFYFLGGYLLYSSLFAAVGSTVNEDPQDAQSLMLPITFPIIFAIVIMTKAANDPNSNLAIFGSLFPLTSPIVMMARIAYGIPEGVTITQLILSMAFLVIGFVGTTWLAGKIYRTGILMYGKKPTWKEMIRWFIKAK